MQIQRPQQLKHQLILTHTQYDTQMYLSTVQNVFVVIVKCISYQLANTVSATIERSADLNSNPSVRPSSDSLYPLLAP